MMGSQGLDPPTVTAGLLDDERMLKALAARDVGAVFKLLNNRGVSTRKLAAAVDISQGRLYDYMSGNCRVEKLSLFEQFADGLRIPGHLLGLASRPWEPAPETSAPAANDLPPDTDDLQAIDAFRHADRQSGGGRLYAAVTQHLTHQIAPRLVDTASGPGVFAAAAALTEMAGWMAHDSAHDELAVKHLTRALPLARVSGDAPLAANIAASTSHLTLHTNDRPGAARWAKTGLHLAAQGPRIPALTARLHTMTARALAAAAQHSPAQRALDQAHAAIAEPVDAVHPWLSPFDAAALASESALVLKDLGRYDQALDQAEQALALREAGRARSLALTRITLADIHIRRGDLDAAVKVGHDLLATSPTLSSVRVIHQLDELRRHLEPHMAYGPVSQYLVRFDDARRARMLLMADIITAPRRTAAHEAHAR
ncbi:XRE family transcriptional regulator [Streptomyces sp. NPDC056257]|uniref:XRE family transcriptional regulator n=1 Tax=Streptomyces sp. NPDC056257 TaxID=3345765 RepID=UPI0035E00BCC